MPCPYNSVMWLLFAVLGVTLLVPGIIGLVRGRVAPLRIRSRVHALVVLGVASLAFAASMATNPYLPQPGPEGVAPADSHGVRANVVRVVDGDTIVVRLDGASVTVRYIGMDTPETVDPQRPVQCYGPEATKRNVALVAGKAVELEPDGQDRDRYGRLLRHVWVEGRIVGLVLLEEGYADVERYPNRYRDDFTRARDAALGQGWGLWGACQ